jgi:hypothetical protein
MTMSGRGAALLPATLLLCLAGPAPLSAQDAGPAPPVDPASITMPDLAFTPTPEIEGNYDKYFVFNRADTDFATAYADLRECDGFARGLTHFASVGGAAAPLGIVGGALADIGSDMIYGSAERRRQRRYNMLTCMRFKDYRVFGLPKDIWETFNFEEGNRRVPEGERQRMLQIQARVASGPAPAVGEVRLPGGGEAAQ